MDDEVKLTSYTEREVDGIERSGVVRRVAGSRAKDRERLEGVLDNKQASNLDLMRSQCHYWADKDE
jgi:hypothetical protein